MRTIIDDWRQEARKEERQLFVQMILQQLRIKAGKLERPSENRVRALPTTRLAKLGLALLHFRSAVDLENWLQEHAPITTAAVSRKRPRG